MTKRIEDVRNIKEGKYIIIDDVPCRITSIAKSKPGKHGSAKAQIVAEDIFTGAKKTLLTPVDDKVEVPMINKRNGQVLTVIGDTVQLMDMETYETFELPMPEDSEIKRFISAGKEVLYIDVMGRRKITQAKGE